MPMPMMPKRRRSLAAIVRARRGSGSSSTVLAAKAALAAAAVIPKNLRREKVSLLIGSPCGDECTSYGTASVCDHELPHRFSRFSGPGVELASIGPGLLSEAHPGAESYFF